MREDLSLQPVQNVNELQHPNNVSLYSAVNIISS